MINSNSCIGCTSLSNKILGRMIGIETIGVIVRRELYGSVQSIDPLNEGSMVQSKENVD